MKAKARQIVSPRKRPRADLEPSENRRRAQYGDLLGTKGAELFDFLRQIVTSKPSPPLCQLFVQELVDLYKASDGEPLRELAYLLERPIAHKAEEIAYQVEARYAVLTSAAKDAKTPKGRRKVKYSAPHIKRTALIAYICEQANCSERTAAAAVDKTTLAKLLNWKSGRPSV